MSGPRRANPYVRAAAASVITVLVILMLLLFGLLYEIGEAAKHVTS